MRKRPYRIICVNCQEFLYTYEGTFEGRFDFGNFKPAPGVPTPVRGQKMSCPVCKKAWYMLNGRGSLVVLTNKGWKPRNPDGPPKVFMPGEAGVSVDYRPSGTEYKE